ncbi:MAG: tetratricopeptide repeat protein [Treponema sp.]|jgi:tetratricopeptide (TPR) repeat protein|nr:tetratricopeptide repeat protein [Treponema sp.]
MKRLKEIILGILVVAVFGSLGVYVYRNEKNRTHKDLAKRIAEVSPRGGPPETIDGLKTAIALYEDQIARNVKEGAQTGVYWKILAVRLADRSMHRDAVDALERAVYYNAEDPAIYYLTGVSAGTVAKSVVGFSANAASEREHFYKLSESAFLRALELDALYDKPMYGLGVLYVFELDRAAEAIPYLSRYLEINRSDVSAMFVLARAHYTAGNYNEAVEYYDRIIVSTKDVKVRAEAQNNKDIVWESMYE